MRGRLIHKPRTYKYRSRSIAFMERISRAEGEKRGGRNPLSLLRQKIVSSRSPSKRVSTAAAEEQRKTETETVTLSQSALARLGEKPICTLVRSSSENKHVDELLARRSMSPPPRSDRSSGAQHRSIYPILGTWVGFFAVLGLAFTIVRHSLLLLTPVGPQASSVYNVSGPPVRVASAPVQQTGSNVPLRRGASSPELGAAKNSINSMFDKLDGDRNGKIQREEIRKFVSSTAGGSTLDETSEVEEGVASVMSNIDGNRDDALSKTDFLDHWSRLGSLLSVDEVAEWVVHAVQLPLEVSESFRTLQITGFDFPELIAENGALLESDLHISKVAFRKRLMQRMQWRMWAVGKTPSPPTDVTWQFMKQGRSRGIAISWAPGDDHGAKASNFPVHKYLLRRITLGDSGEVNQCSAASLGDSWESVCTGPPGRANNSAGWVTLMDGPALSYFDSGLKGEGPYLYRLEAWNALGRSDVVTFEVWGESSDGVRQDGSLPPFQVAGFAALVVAAIFLRRMGNHSNVPSAIPGHPSPVRRKISASSTSDRHNSGSPSLGNTAGRSLQMVTVAAMDVHPSNSLSPKRILKSLSSGGTPGHNTGLSRSMSTSPMANVHDHDYRRTSSAVTPGHRLFTAGNIITGNGSKSVLNSLKKEAALRALNAAPGHGNGNSGAVKDSGGCHICVGDMKWYSTRHTCKVCLKGFCQRHGRTSHTLPVCPVGSNCVCQACVVLERGGASGSSAGSSIPRDLSDRSLDTNHSGYNDDINMGLHHRSSI